MYLLPTYFLFLFILNSPQIRFSDNWKNITSADGQFSIEFPGAPKISYDTLEAREGKMFQCTMNYLAEKNSDLNGMYSLSYSEFPEYYYLNSHANDSTLDVHFDQAIATILGSLGDAKLIYVDTINISGTGIPYADDSTKFKYQSFPGRIFKIDIGYGRVITAVTYLVYKRQYSLMTGCRMENDDNENMKRFFNSFRLLHP